MGWGAMTPTLAYLLGLVTLPGMVLGLGAAFYVCDRAAGWWRGPMRRWSALARIAGSRRALAVRDGRVYAAHLYAAADIGALARRWARWAPWWPA